VLEVYCKILKVIKCSASEKRLRSTDLGCHLTLWCLVAFGDFREKNTETHVALRGNFSGPVNVTDSVKVSKDTASLVACTRKKFFYWGYRFFVSDVISGGLLGHLGPNR